MSTASEVEAGRSDGSGEARSALAQRLRSWTARPRPRVRISRSTSLLLAVTLGQMAVLTVVFWNSNYWFDDLLYFEQVQQGTISLHHMMFPMFGHMAPGHNFVYWALQRTAPAHFRVALALEVAVSGAVTLLLARVLRLLSHRPMLSAVVASMLAVSATQVAAFAWFAADTDCTFSTLFTLVAAERFLVWRTSRQRAALVVCLVSWAVGLSFYEEPAFLPLYLAAIVAFVLPGRFSLRSAWVELASLWQAWLGFAATGVAWLALYARGPYGSFLPKPSVDQFTGFLWVAWFRNFWMTAVGASVNLLGPEGGDYLRLFGQAVFVLLVVVTVARRRAAWRAWVFFVASFVVHVGVIAYGRAWMGSSQALQSFYVYESGWLLAITFCCAVGAAAPAEDKAAVAPLARRSAVPRPGHFLRVGLVAALLVVAGVRGTIAASWTYHNYPGQNVTTWTHNVRTSAAALHRSGQQFSVFDTKVATFFWQFTYPESNRASKVLNIGYAKLTYDQLEAPTYLIDPLGHLVPAVFAVRGTWKAPASGPTCFSEQDSLELAHYAKADSLFLRLRTVQPTATKVHLWLRPKTGGDAIATDTDRLVDVPAGSSDMLIPVAPTEATAVVVSPVGPPVCIARAQVGEAVQQKPAS